MTYNVHLNAICLQKVKGKQWPGTDAIRTKVPPSKPKWEITNYNKSKFKENIGKPNEQLSQKRVTSQLQKPN